MQKSVTEPPSTPPPKFEGFALPTVNYFKVPNIWLGMLREISSGTTALTIEYLFRHGWGYHNPHGVWLDADEIAYGRRRGTGRYDNGIHADLSGVHRAVEEGVTRGLLVWRQSTDERIPRREYNLYLTGMSRAADGKFIEPTTGNLEEVSGNVEVEIQPKPASGDVEVVTRNLEEVSSKVEETVGNGEEVAGNVEVVSGKVEAVSGKVEAVSGKVEAVSGKVEARSAKADTLKDTSPPTLKATPAADTSLPRGAQSLWIAAVAEPGVSAFLEQLEINNPAREQIAKKNFAPSELTALALDIWQRRNITTPAALLITSCRDHHLAPGTDFVKLAASPLQTLAQLLHHEWSADTPTEIAQIWQKRYGLHAAQRLPPPIYELLKNLKVERIEVMESAPVHPPAPQPQAFRETERTAPELHELWQTLLTQFYFTNKPKRERCYEFARLRADPTTNSFIIEVRAPDLLQQLTNQQPTLERLIKNEKGPAAQIQVVADTTHLTYLPQEITL